MAKKNIKRETKPKYKPIGKSHSGVYSYIQEGNTYYAYRIVINRGKFIDTFHRLDGNGNKYTSVDEVELDGKRRKLELKKQWEEQKENNKTAKAQPRVKHNATFGEVWKIIKDDYEKHNQLTTLKKHESIWNNHLRSHFQDIKFSEVTKDSLEDFITKKRNETYIQNDVVKHYQPSFVGSIYRTLKIIIHKADELNYLPSDKRNLTKIKLYQASERKQNVKKKKLIITKKEANEIFFYLKENHTAMLLPFLVSYYCGLRPAEAFAVKFSDFTEVADKDTGGKIYKLTVNKQIVYGSPYHEMQSPKTAKSIREVPVPDFVMNEVKKRQQEINEYKNKHKVEYQANIQKHSYKETRRNITRKKGESNIINFDGFISQEIDGTYRSEPSGWKRPCKYIKENIIVPRKEGEYTEYRFYSHRHSYLSEMANSGIAPAHLMSLAGHSKPDTLYEYYYGETENALEQKNEVVNKVFLSPYHDDEERKKKETDEEEFFINFVLESDNANLSDYADVIKRLVSKGKLGKHYLNQI